MKPVRPLLPLLMLSLLMPFCVHAETRDRTLQEMVASVHAKAAKLDKNHDGILSDKETAKGREKFGWLGRSVEKAVDANHDGIITVREYTDVQVKEIRKADQDNNGIITVHEQKKQKQALVRRLLGGG